MANFEKAVEVVLEHEGGLVSDYVDPGGITNWGISFRFAKSIGIDVDGNGLTTPEDIQQLSRGQAIEIYRTQFWLPLQLDKVASQIIATKFFDCAVNMGTKRATLLCQTACRLCGFPILVDGVMGPQTLRALELVNPRAWMIHMCYMMRKTYDGIIARRPEASKYRDGWMNRAGWGKYQAFFERQTT